MVAMDDPLDLPDKLEAVRFLYKDRYAEEGIE
jgi:hypothetical protein